MLRLDLKFPALGIIYCPSGSPASAPAAGGCDVDTRKDADV
jgi:hypothetical protein